MTKFPNIVHLDRLMADANTVRRQIGIGKWVPCRGEGLPTIPNRFRAAWLVFTGRADALIWPGDQ